MIGLAGIFGISRLAQRIFIVKTRRIFHLNETLEGVDDGATE